MKRYVVGYIKYQHATIGDDDAYDGWQSFYTSAVFNDKSKAMELLNKLKKDRFVKNAFVAEEIDE